MLDDNEHSYNSHDTSMRAELPRWSINKSLCFHNVQKSECQRRGKCVRYLNSISLIRKAAFIKPQFSRLLSLEVLKLGGKKACNYVPV